MQDGDSVRKAGGKAFNSLRSERDFRYQDNAPPARFHCLRECPQVYLGLTAAGNAVEQKNPGLSSVIMYRFAYA